MDCTQIGSAQEQLTNRPFESRAVLQLAGKFIGRKGIKLLGQDLNQPSLDKTKSDALTTELILVPFMFRVSS